jgi:hypothetical protein
VADLYAVARARVELCFDNDHLTRWKTLRCLRRNLFLPFSKFSSSFVSLILFYSQYDGLTRRQQNHRIFFSVLFRHFSTACSSHKGQPLSGLGNNKLTDVVANRTSRTSITLFKPLLRSQRSLSVRFRELQTHRAIPNLNRCHSVSTNLTERLSRFSPVAKVSLRPVLRTTHLPQGNPEFQRRHSFPTGLTELQPHFSNLYFCHKGQSLPCFEIDKLTARQSRISTSSLVPNQTVSLCPILRTTSLPQGNPKSQRCHLFPTKPTEFRS